jgi:hypothetical protein
MKKEKVIEIMDRELPTHGAVWFELHSGTQFEIIGTRYEIIHNTLEIYSDDELAAIVYLDDIRLLGTMG